MKKKAGIVFLVLAVSLMICSASMAGNRAEAWSVTPFVGGYHFNSDTRLDKALIGGLRIGYNLTEAWGLEALVHYGKDNNYYVVRDYDPRGRDAGFDDDARIVSYRVEALYNFMPDKKFVPFLAAGVGGRNVNYVSNNTYDEDSTKHLVLGYGVGFKFFFAEDWALRGDVRHLFLPNDRLHNLEYTLGISYFFGGKKPVIPEPEPAPAPVVAAPAPAPVVEDAPILKCTDTPSDLMVDKDGCPIKVTVNMNVLFDFDKSDIKPKYHDELKRVSDYMHAYPWETAVLEGHTDSRGTEEYNIKLSQRRVNNIKKYLVEKLGVDADRLTAIGYGKSRPIASNDTDEGRQLNRRVQAVMETYIKKQQD